MPTPGHLPRAFSVSRDGDRLAFSSGSYILDIWRIPGPAGRRGEQHPPEGQPFISTTMVVSNPQYSREEEQITDRGHAMFWDIYDQGACWTDPLPEEVTVECLHFESAGVNTVARFPNGGRLRQTGPSFAVSPDGQWILYSRVEREDADLMLVDNFGAMRQR